MDIQRLPRWHSGKECPRHCRRHRDVGSMPGLGRTPGAVNCNLLQYSCLENSIDRGAWWATVHGATNSDTTEHNSNNKFNHGIFFLPFPSPSFPHMQCMASVPFIHMAPFLPLPAMPVQLTTVSTWKSSLSAFPGH